MRLPGRRTKKRFFAQLRGSMIGLTVTTANLVLSRHQGQEGNRGPGPSYVPAGALGRG